ncbi:hypothetical protein ACFL6A_01065 [bacterium]
MSRFIQIFFFLLFLILACKSTDPISNDSPDPVNFPGAVQLTTEIEDIFPDWSPTGEKIAFERRGNIYTLLVESGALFLMTEGHSPAWSLDGQYIAFVRDGEIYTVRDIPERPVQKVTLGAMASRVSGLDWGTAGRIAYFQPGDSLNSDRYLKIYSFYSNQIHHVQHESLGYAELPDWSRGGSQLVFSSRSEGICIYDVKTEIVRSLVYWGNPGKPCFYSSVDSTFVIFVENGYLYRINPDGTNRSILYGDDFYPGSMDYSFPTSRLTFSQNGIWIMDFPPEEEQLI